MTRLPLRTLLPSLVLAAAPLACGASPTPMTEAVSCLVDAGRYAKLTLAAGTDGVAMFNLPSAPDANGIAPAAVALSAIGTPCATADDRDACLARVDTMRSADGWKFREPGASAWSDYVQYVDYGVATRGNEVFLVATLDQLRQLIAPVGGIEEAGAFALVSGVPYTCGQPNARVDEDGVVFQSLTSSCSGEEWEYLRKMSWDGTVVTISERQLHSADNGCIEGRRPPGLAARTQPWLHSLPAHLAEIAHMEAAAVLAFESLGRELARLQAPPALQARVEKARLDELEHAAIMTALARRHGAEPARPALQDDGACQGSLFDLAIDNATEGCVREAYGALVATYQATYAADPDVRAAFVRIAADETEHAELSFELGVWLEGQLSAPERARVARARERAWNDVAHACDVEPALEVRRAAGMPSAHAARQLLAGLRAHVTA